MGLRYSEQAVGVIATLAPATKKALRKALDNLVKDPIGAPGLDVKLLRSLRGVPVYRLRLGDYRVAYRVLPGRVVYVQRVFHRRDGYGWMERT